MSCTKLFNGVCLCHLKGWATIFADVFTCLALDLIALALASSVLDSEVTEVVDREDCSEKHDNFAEG